MADLRIVDAPVLLQESITDDVKMPTGGLGNYAIRLGDLVWYVVAKENLASKSYVDTSSKGVKDSLDVHVADKDNPHQVTKVQVGLGNVDNTADVDKPVSNAVNSAIITATTDMATKTYVNQKDNLKADKATTLSGYGITDAYTKDETYNKTEVNDTLTLKANLSYVDSKDGDLTTLKTTDKSNLVKSINEVFDNTKGVVDLYKQNLLANPSKGWSASLIEDKSGIVQQQINDAFTIPEMFGAKPNDASFDNTEALNRAFATGRDIYGKKDDVYYVNGILNTKGQQLVGGWKISTSRYNLGVVNTDNYAPSTDTYIRMIYLESAYDLVELLHIKALGYNMINHYGYFKNITHDADGTYDKLLNNCKTVGLKVNMGTESDEAKASLDNFVKKYQGHPNVWGFASFDEGVQRGFSIADQDTRIATIKKYTTKPVTIVEFVSNPFKQVFSKNHDYVFVDSYSLVHTNITDLNTKVNQDLSNMRLHYGCVKGMTRCKNTIPALGLFAYKPEANYYANDIEQIILAAREFVKSGNGNYAVFVWDGSGDISITSNVRNNQKLKEFSLELSQFSVNQPKYETDVLLFGGSSETWVHSITDLFNLLPTVDKNTTEPHVASNAYPMVIRPSQTSTETERFHLVNNSSYYGIGMKGDYCAILLNQKVRKYTRCKLDFSHLLANVSGNFELLGTDDNGYTPKLIFQDGFTSNKVFDFLSNSTTPDSHLILRMTFNGDTASANYYRKFLFGLIVCSDW